MNLNADTYTSPSSPKRTIVESGILSRILDYSYFKVEMLDFKPQKSNFSVKKSSFIVLRVPYIAAVNQFCHI